MLHYPVTTSDWRGVFAGKNVPLRRQLRAACGWQPIAWDAAVEPQSVDIALFTKALCADCSDYVRALCRMGRLPSFLRTRINEVQPCPPQ